MKRPLAVLVALLVLPGCQGSGGSGAAKDPFFGRTRIEPPRTGTVAGQLPAPESPGAAASALSPGTARPPAAIPAPASNNLPIWSPPPWQTPATTLPGASQGGNLYDQPSGSTGYQPPLIQSPPPPFDTPGDRLSIPFAARALAEPPRQLRTSGALDNPLRNPAELANQPAVRAPAGGASPTASSPSGGADRPASSPYPSGLGTNRLAGRERVVQVIEPSRRSDPNPLRNAPRPIDPSSSQGSAVSGRPSETPVNITDLPEPGKSPSGR
jgi:hypothetical protein